MVDTASQRGCDKMGADKIVIPKGHKISVCYGGGVDSTAILVRGLAARCHINSC